MTADYTETHPLVDVRRIIGINKKDKYEWVKDLIDKTKPIKNLNLAFINASHIESRFPHSIISCRIIDDNKLFLPYPALNYVPGGGPSRDAPILKARPW